MDTVKIRLMFWLSIFIKAVTVVTAHLMTGRYIPHDLNSLLFILSFGEMFSYFATSWK